MITIPLGLCLIELLNKFAITLFISSGGIGKYYLQDFHGKYF